MAIAKDLESCHYIHFAPPCNTYSRARYPKVRPGSEKMFSQTFVPNKSQPAELLWIGIIRLSCRKKNPSSFYLGFHSGRAFTLMAYRGWMMKGCPLPTELPRTCAIWSSTFWGKGKQSWSQSRILGQVFCGMFPQSETLRRTTLFTKKVLVVGGWLVGWLFKLLFLLLLLLLLLLVVLVLVLVFVVVLVLVVLRKEVSNKTQDLANGPVVNASSVPLFNRWKEGCNFFGVFWLGHVQCAEDFRLEFNSTDDSCSKQLPLSTAWKAKTICFCPSSLQEVGTWNTIDFDMCMYGCEYKKSTRIMMSQRRGTNCVLAPLGLTCDRSHEHVSLSGWGTGPKRPTKGTAVYPDRLGREWANFAAGHLRRHAMLESDSDWWVSTRDATIPEMRYVFKPQKI